MVQVIDATYDGTVIRPDKPLTLDANTRVRITVETIVEDRRPHRSFLRTAQALNLDGPADWSENFELYF